MKELENKFKTVFYNIRGPGSKRKLIVFESDDWGSIRTPSAMVLETLKQKGIPIDKTPYMFDSIESNEDISALANTLNSFKDISGNMPVFTLYNIVANPDFKRIRESSFTKYYSESFIQTYNTYSGRESSYRLLQEGVRKGVFKPQFHGREHLNVRRWMKALQNQMPETSYLFDLGMYGLPAKLSKENRRCFQRAFDLDHENEKVEKCKILSEGLDMFEKLWGYKSKTFVPPNYFWFDELEQCAKLKGVDAIHGQRVQYTPDFNGGLKSIRRYMGQQNRYGQRYWIRNCYFEPSLQPYKDWVDSCLFEIKTAFLFNKPAIVGTHRVNYIGSISEANRSRNIDQLNKLLKIMISKWQNIEFVCSETLD